MWGDHVTRNEEIFKRREAGETYKSIADSYGISVERARQIYSELRQKLEVSTHGPVDNPTTPEESALYHLILNFKPAIPLEPNSTVPKRAYSILQHEWFQRTNHGDNCPPVEFLAAMSEDHISKLRNVGEITQQFLFEVKAAIPDMVVLPDKSPVADKGQSHH